MLKCIDVSHNNGVIDFEKVKASGVNNVIIRAGYGYNTLDKQFKNNVKNALKNNFNVGLYWFGYATSVNDAIKEADFFVQTIKNNDLLGKINLPVFYDWEYDSYNYSVSKGIKPTKDLISDIITAFCKRMESYGFYTGFYANVDYLTHYIRPNVLEKYCLWCASWTAEKPKKYIYDIWQYGAEINKLSSKYINGVSGVVDQNYIYKNFPSLIKKGFNGYALQGDITQNGIIDKDDYLKLQNALANSTVDQLKNADYNGDGVVNTADLLALKQYLIKNNKI